MEKPLGMWGIMTLQHLNEIPKSKQFSVADINIFIIKYMYGTSQFSHFP